MTQSAYTLFKFYTHVFRINAYNNTHTHTHTHTVVYQGSGTEESFFFSEEKGFQGLDEGVVRYC